MKQNFLLKTMLLLCALIVGSSSTWADDLTIDFESAASAYSDWTFTNATTQSTNKDVTAHGGSYFGTTGGKATASIVTNNIIASPQSIVFYVSKQTTNTKSSNWYVKVSTDGSTWTQVGDAQDGASMSKGEWVEVERDLSSYSNVYVKIEYSGSTAVRCIDDVTLTTGGSSSNPSITASDVNIEYNAANGSIGYKINNGVTGGAVTAAIKSGTTSTITNLSFGDVTDTAVPFTCDANDSFTDRTATVTLTYTYNTSETVTKDVVITQAAAPKPSITADDVDLTYDATSGSIAYSLENATGSVSAVVTDGDWLTLGTITASEVPFTCSANTGEARTAKVTLSFTDADDKIVTVTQNAAPYSGPGYVRVNSLDYLTDGAKVIIAARYNSTASSYYAMTAAATGKPVGVSFSSSTTTNGEEIPTSILNDQDANNESTYYWTVGVTTTNNVKYYTFTNAANKTLGYTSGTNFAIGGDNTEWVASIETAGDDAMVGGYEGFYIYNKNSSARGIALNSSHNFGPYDKGTNSNSSSYNFYLDIFVEGAVLKPSISASKVDIDYDDTEGSISYTIKNAPSPAGILTAEIKEGSTIEGLTLGSITGTEVPFTCSANATTDARTATITLTYTYNTTETVTKDVTITQTGNPNASLENIAALTKMSDGEYYVTLTDALVTYVNGNNAYIEDASGAVLLYGCANNIDGLAVGDKYTGTAYVYYKVYKNLPEVTALALEDGFIKTTGNDVTPVTITIEDLLADYDNYLSRYVKIENATVSSAFDDKSCTIEQNGEAIWLRDQNSTATLTSTLNDVVTVTGHPAIYNTTKQIALYEQSQIVVVAVPVNISAAGLATFASSFALDFTGTDGIEAYIAKEKNSKIELTKVNKVPAGTGVLLRSVSGEAKSANVPVTEATANNVADNLFVRGTGDPVVSEPTTGTFNYVLGKHNGVVGFYKAGGMVVAADKAYLQTTLAAARIDINFDEATGINTVNDEREMMNGECFDLQGRKIAQPTKGLYIMNGKKVVIK